MPQDKVAMNLLPHAVAVKAEVTGYSLLTGDSGEKNDTITIDANKFRGVTKKGKRLSFYHVKPQLKELTTANYSEYKVSDILIDTIFIDFEKRASKRLLVEPRFDIQTEKQYVFDGKIDLLPTAIEVSGPKSLLDTMKVLPSNYLAFKDVNEDITATLSFELAKDDRFSFTPRNALATFKINKITESKVEVPVKAINLPKGSAIKTFPNKVTVTYLVDLEHYNSIIANDFEVVIDYNDVENTTQKLSVKVTDSPRFVTITRIEPSRLEYIIKK